MLNLNKDIPATGRRPAGKRLRLGVAAISLCCATAAPALAAQDLTKWAGVYDRVGSLNYDPNSKPGAIDDPPYIPEYEAKAKVIRDGLATGKPLEDTGAKCLPKGLIHMMANVYPMEIITTPDEVTFIAEEFIQIRRIYLNGKGPPPQPFQTYNGYSVGHWEGDVLVVESNGFRDDQALAWGLPLGPGIHLTERMHLDADGATFVDDETVTGPSLTKPYSVTRRYKRNPKLEAMEYLCENNRNPVSADGITGVLLKGTDGESKTFIK